MSRKDYQLIAGSINDAISDIQVHESPQLELMLNVVQHVAYAISDSLQADNNRFDRSRFLKACGVEE